MRTAWMQSCGQRYLVERFDDGSFGITLGDDFLGFVLRVDGDYLAIDGTEAGEGGVVAATCTLGAAAAALAGTPADHSRAHLAAVA
ncbi:hypothetical protein VD659_00415 [Herbiconiux sp. 11R-BC]|uniref:hypothetical protein n=1 Tax=Herbiconiux sp. 11R-BC TaxID=3111637 RepID=UPI003C00AA18